MQFCLCVMRYIKMFHIIIIIIIIIISIIIQLIYVSTGKN